MYTKKIYLLLLFCLSFLMPAYSAVDSALYQGEAPVASYLPADWQKAVVPALQQVLVRISGNANVGQNEIVRKVLAKPNTLVQSYNYVTGTQEKALMLQVRFSPKAINKLLQDANQPNLALKETVGNTTTIAPVAVDALAAPSPNQETAIKSINMVVSGISNLQDYTAVLDYLRHLEGVVDVNSKQTRGDRILLVLKINKAVDDLMGTIAKENKLVKNNATTTSVLMYRWVANVSASPANTSATVESTSPMLPSSSIAPQEQFLPKTNSGAPIVEGVPAAALNSTMTPALINDGGPAQSFAAPSTDIPFVSEDGVRP